MAKEETQPPQPQFIAQWCRVKICNFNREINRRLQLNWQCNRLRLHFIFGQFNRLRLPLLKTLNSIVIDYDWRLPHVSMGSVAYLCKMAPLAKFEWAPFWISWILDIGTIFAKDNHEENKMFWNRKCMLIFADVSANKIINNRNGWWHTFVLIYLNNTIINTLYWLTKL